MKNKNKFEIPILLDTDTYKMGHPRMYPSDIIEMTAYFTCRGPLFNNDQRIVYYGMRYAFDTVISRQITIKDIEEADEWLQSHGVANTQMNWPRDLWLDVVQKHNGYIPVTIKTLREGSVVFPQLPLFEITAKKSDLTGADFQYLVTYFETALMRIWSPTVTATKSAHAYDHLLGQFEKTVDKPFYFLLESRLHDFGSRGVSSQETAMVTGMAHLTSFDGTDTMIAGKLATEYNDGKHIGTSVLATEHSVMTCWETEIEAVKNAIKIAPNGSILSVVADTYDYDNFLTNILPEIAPLSKAKELLFVIRPDSGDPVECVINGLKAAEKAFGSTLNTKGYKVLDGAAVIQGDGIDLTALCIISNEVTYAGFSAQNVAYGMGGALLQKQNRDTLKVAIKLCAVKDVNGIVHGRMKIPKTDHGKNSTPGPFKVVMKNGLPVVTPIGSMQGSHGSPKNLLETIWDCGPVDYEWETIDQIRDRIRGNFGNYPLVHNVFTDEMNEYINEVIANIRNN